MVQNSSICLPVAAVSAAAAAEAGATAAAAAATAAAAAVAGAAASLRFFVTPTYVSTIADVASDIKMSFNEISLQTEKKLYEDKRLPVVAIEVVASPPHLPEATCPVTRGRLAPRHARDPARGLLRLRKA